MQKSVKVAKPRLYLYALRCQTSPLRVQGKSSNIVWGKKLTGRKLKEEHFLSRHSAGSEYLAVCYYCVITESSYPCFSFGSTSNLYLHCCSRCTRISKRIEIQVLAYAGFECLQLKQLHRAATMAQSHNGDLWTRITAAHERLRRSRVETPVCKCCCPALWKRLWGKCKETNHSVVKGMKSLAFLNQMRSLSLPDILFMSTIIKCSVCIYYRDIFQKQETSL